MFHPTHNAAATQSRQGPYHAPPGVYYPKSNGGYNPSLPSNYFPHPQASFPPVNMNPGASGGVSNQSIGQPYPPGPSQWDAYRYRSQYSQAQTQASGSHAPTASYANSKPGPYPYPYPHPYYPNGNVVPPSPYHTTPSWSVQHQGHFPASGIPDMNMIPPNDPRYYVPRPKSRTPSPSQLWVAEHGASNGSRSQHPTASSTVNQQGHTRPILPSGQRIEPSPSGAPSKVKSNAELKEERRRDPRPLKPILRNSRGPKADPGSNSMPSSSGTTTKVKDPQTDDIRELTVQLSAIIGKHNTPRNQDHSNPLTSAKSKGKEKARDLGGGGEDDASSMQVSDWGTISSPEKVSVVPNIHTTSIQGMKGASASIVQGSKSHRVFLQSHKSSTSRDHHIPRPATPYNKDQLPSDTPRGYTAEATASRKPYVSLETVPNKRKPKLSAFSLGLTRRRDD